jgi:hypothetical protein
MQTMPNEPPISPSVTRGFTILVLFFFGVLVFELLSGESLGVPAKRTAQPVRYWIILTAQAVAGILFVALLYFLTH